MSLTSTAPRFDGDTFHQERDGKRLMAQMARVWRCMRDQKFRSLHTISIITGDPEGSISARLRDFRKERFGAHTVNRRYLANGHFEYQVVPSGNKLIELMASKENTGENDHAQQSNR